jgi:hypothetical protein
VQAEHDGADAGRGVRRVAIETATITVKASGAVQAAGPADRPGRPGPRRAGGNQRTAGYENQL